MFLLNIVYIISVGQNWPLNDGHEGVQEGMPNGDVDGLSCRFASILVRTKRPRTLHDCTGTSNGIEASSLVLSRKCQC